MRFGLVLILAAAPLVAQTGTVTSSTSTASSQTVRGAATMSAPRFAGPVFTNAPYSAQRVVEHVQVGADGTRFTTTNQQETIYRDSQGRTRTERRMMMGANAPESPTLIEITDPVSNVGYTLDAQNKVAHRYSLQGPPGRAMTAVSASGTASSNTAVLSMISGVATASEPPPPPPPPGVPPAFVMNTPVQRNGVSRPDVKQEDLGTQMIEGVLAKGTRHTQTWPTGSAGNDRPFQTVSETWYSESLKMPVLTRNSDPRGGENTMKLTNISLSEPMSTLFAPPADFTVVDETGPFEIRWSSPRQ
jgi:hypothetical protein